MSHRRSLFPLLPCLALALAVGLAPAGGVRSSRAQGSPADSTAAPPPGGLAGVGALAAAQLDSAATDSTASDSLAVDPGFVWFSGLEPLLEGSVRATVSQVDYSAGISANAEMFGGGRTSSSLTRGFTDYRQQDRNSESRRFLADYSHTPGGWMSLDLNASATRLEDETRLEPVQGVTQDPIVVANEARNAQLRLGTANELGAGFRQNLRLVGEAEDVQASNRGTPNNRNLAGGTVAGRLGYDRGWVDVLGRFGLERSGGSRTLAQQDADATTRQDTLGTTVKLAVGTLDLTATADHIRFDEERLDFARTALGQIIPPDRETGEQEVGDERERVDTSRLGVQGSWAPVSRLALDFNAGSEYSEKSLSFSQEGIRKRGYDRFGLGSSFQYAAAGTLSVDYTYDEDWNDRRTREDERFRGRQIGRSQELGFELRQRVFRRTTLVVDYSQRLVQDIYLERQNKNDSDNLTDRARARLRSEAIPRVRLYVQASADRRNLVNIDAERVGNNLEDRLYEVAGGYRYRALPWLVVDQAYLVQIVFKDYHNSDSRDQFNKKAQLDSELKFTLPRASTLDLVYTVDFRQNGTRDPEARGVAYFPDLRRYDHSLRAVIQVPLGGGLAATMQSERGFLRDDALGRRPARADDRGQWRLKLSGQRSLWGERLDLALDLEKVNAFGPLVRDQNRDYWTANSSVKVRF